MKKIAVFILFFLSVISVNARSTYFNVRVGGGLRGDYKTPGSYVDPSLPELTSTGGLTFIFQPNIMFGSDKRFVFSPTLQYDFGFNTGDHNDYSHQISVPLLVGYRIKIGNGSFFVPKIGPVVGYFIKGGSRFSARSSWSDDWKYGGVSNGTGRDGDGEYFLYKDGYVTSGTVKGDFVIGPYIDLCFEIKRFVVGLNAYYSFTSRDIEWTRNHTGDYKVYVKDASKVELTPSYTTSGSISYHSYALSISFGYKF